MPKKAAKVRPSVTLLKDEQGNTTRSDYHYPAAPGCTVNVLSWNKDLSPPNGDFLQEQMWVIEGPQDGIDVFFADPRVTEVTKDECCDTCCQWDQPKGLLEPVREPGTIVCPDCGEELECGNKACQTGKPSVHNKKASMKRAHRGWQEVDHAHHLEGVS